MSAKLTYVIAVLVAVMGIATFQTISMLSSSQLQHNHHSILVSARKSFGKLGSLNRQNTKLADNQL